MKAAIFHNEHWACFGASCQPASLSRRYPQGQIDEKQLNGTADERK